MTSWTVIQKLCLVIGVLFLVHAIGGMIANPDFAVGDGVTSEVWLWMDWNGWHALTGIVLWATSIAVAFRADIARLFAYLVVVTELPVVIWMLFDPRPLRLFLLPTTADLVIHAATVVAFALALVIDRGRTSVPVA